jgi:hypothetical protein
MQYSDHRSKNFPGSESFFPDRHPSGSRPIAQGWNVMRKSFNFLKKYTIQTGLIELPCQMRKGKLTADVDLIL